MTSTSKPGIFYLVPSPIGNLQEITPRILETLKNVDYIFCEDTRNTGKLLSLLSIENKKMVSCHKFNELEKSSILIDYLNSGLNVAYLSDAGYPGISDPGSVLVKKVVEAELKVVPLSGPTASLTSLIASSLDTSHFLFYGFLDHKKGPRIKEIEALKSFPYTIIFYESPYRINETLEDLYTILGNRKATIAREISKLHEEFVYSSLEELSKEKKEYKGEIVLIIEGNSSSNSLDENLIYLRYKKLVSNNFSPKDAINSLSLVFDITKSEIKNIINKKEN